ncbi:MAG: hypothetical protein ACREGJ_02640 [Candidatus Saccharimonadales bacterium]
MENKQRQYLIIGGVIAAVVLVIVIVLLIANGGSNTNQNQQPISTPNEQTQQQAQEPTGPPKNLREAQQQLKRGMTKEEVDQIMGALGIQGECRELTTVVCDYSEGGSKLNATVRVQFKENKLIMSDYTPASQ